MSKLTNTSIDDELAEILTDADNTDNQPTVEPETDIEDNKDESTQTETVPAEAVKVDEPTKPAKPVMPGVLLDLAQVEAMLAKVKDGGELTIIEQIALQATLDHYSVTSDKPTMPRKGDVIGILDNKGRITETVTYVRNVSGSAMMRTKSIRTGKLVMVDGTGIKLEKAGETGNVSIWSKTV